MAWGCDLGSAQDHVQELFLGIFRRGELKLMDMSRNLRPWLQQKLNWLILEARRREQRRRRILGGECLELEQAVAAVAHSGETPDQAAERVDVARVLEECGVTEASVIWNPQMTNAERVRLYRFRKQVAWVVREKLEGGTYV
jgi:DNA-directed RNA polymerase specialized sigma24 family protein